MACLKSYLLPQQLNLVFSIENFNLLGNIALGQLNERVTIK